MQYTIVPTDTPATYLRLQLHRPTLLQRVYRELAATLLVAGYVETKAGVAGQRGLSGGLAEAGRSSGQPVACSGAESSRRRAS